MAQSGRGFVGWPVLHFRLFERRKARRHPWLSFSHRLARLRCGPRQIDGHVTEMCLRAARGLAHHRHHHPDGRRFRRGVLEDRPGADERPVLLPRRRLVCVSHQSRFAKSAGGNTGCFDRLARGGTRGRLDPGRFQRDKFQSDPQPVQPRLSVHEREPMEFHLVLGEPGCEPAYCMVAPFPRLPPPSPDVAGSRNPDRNG